MMKRSWRREAKGLRKETETERERERKCVGGEGGRGNDPSVEKEQKNARRKRSHTLRKSQ